MVLVYNRGAVDAPRPIRRPSPTSRLRRLVNCSIFQTMQIGCLRFMIMGLATACGTAPAERINHEGRILGPEPVVAAPTLFNTAAADAIVSAMQIMPVDSAWNEDIRNRPLLANSAAMITQIRADLAANRQTLRPFFEMNYVLVPDGQATRAIEFFNYADESDLDGGTHPYGLYPIPPNMPVETWPRETGNLTLQQWQEDVNNAGGDRHCIIVMPGAGFIWETWLTRLVGGNWEASNGAKFSLATNALRPAGWTSADAAGLPMFPALVRYDECERGVVEHALRLIVAKTRRQYIYPATHYASSIPATATEHPAMGQRLRLKASFVIPAHWTKHERAVLFALKKYGAIVADNGNFFSISVCPDNRFPANALSNLTTIEINNFEVIQTTSATGGPRSPGAPRVDAGEDQTIPFGTALILDGGVDDPGGNASLQWRQYSGPGLVTFANASDPQTSATFSAPGAYTLMLSAVNGLHPAAYDAVAVRLPPAVTLTRQGNDILLRFPTAPDRRYRLEQKSDLLASEWLRVAEVAGSGGEATPVDYGAANESQRFYRVVELP